MKILTAALLFFSWGSWGTFGFGESESAGANCPNDLNLQATTWGLMGHDVGLTLDREPAGNSWTWNIESAESASDSRSEEKDYKARNATIKYPDGRIAAQYPNGDVETKYPDGRVKIEYADGRVETRADTWLKTEYPNGRIETEDYFNGIIMIKDPNGLYVIKHSNGNVETKYPEKWLNLSDKRPDRPPAEKTIVINRANKNKPAAPKSYDIEDSPSGGAGGGFPVIIPRAKAIEIGARKILPP